MTGVRRALFFASAGRYVVMAIGMAGTIIVARLLTPEEFGISVTGGALLVLAESLRESGSVHYLVQQQDLSLPKIRTAFTLSVIVSVIMACIGLSCASAISSFYGDSRVAEYISVGFVAFLLGPVVQPNYGLASRNMEFAKIAAVDIATTTINVIASVSFVLMGWSFLSIAMAGLISGLSGTLIWSVLGGRLTYFRPSLQEWRSVVSFGIFGSATSILNRVGDSFLLLLVGRILDPTAVALYQRATLISSFPDRVVLAGVGAVALPALSDAAGNDGDLKTHYLRALELVTVVQWPALIMLGLLAEPLVPLLLGPHWAGVIPLVQIMVAALALNALTALNYPVLVAAGAIHRTTQVAVLQTAFTVAVAAVAASVGLSALAWATWLTIPVTVAASLFAARSVVRFDLPELGAALAQSGTATLFAVVPPAVFLYATNWPETWAAILISAALSALGWLFGLWLSRHPMLDEIRRLVQPFLRHRLLRAFQ
jgi:O-antigen/teichoic acid export membrane protein